MKLNNLATLHNLERAKQRYVLILCLKPQVGSKSVIGLLQHNLCFKEAFKLLLEPYFGCIGCCNKPTVDFLIDGNVRANSDDAYAITFVAGVLSELNTIAEFCSKELPMMYLTVMNSLDGE
ncbi:hypothetical protein AMTRI_Chr08g163820 [Amborella trichopoda]